jgi:alpha-D-ribose 1-methylphosphonate 5-triphosphate synthase subunit PhnH
MSDVQLLQSPQDLALLFRSILGCFSKPAVAVKLTTPANAPPPLLPSTAAIALTLFDYQTPVWLSTSVNTDAVRKFIRFHTGATITTRADEAGFAIITLDEANADWPPFNMGTHAYPDRSTTLIVQIPSFCGGSPVQVSGPGLKESVSLCVEAAYADFWKRVQDNNSLFPIGLDVILASSHHIAALPRSSRVDMLEPA